MSRREATYTTLLMATGLTFGTISALFGFQKKIIDQRHYTILVTVVILSDFAPTLFAQKFFQPTKDAMHAWGRLFIAADLRLNQSKTYERINQPIDGTERQSSPEPAKVTDHMNWFTWSILSTLFAALTTICAKIGIEGIDSNLATAIRTCVILFVG